MNRLDALIAPAPRDVSVEVAPLATARFLGRNADIWRMLARGVLLCAATLGLYGAWLIADLRRYLWTHTEVDGDGFEYIGDALALLSGFLKVVAVLILLYGVSSIAAVSLGASASLAGLFAVTAIAYLGPFIAFEARRYRLTRTVFRGLRFSQTGSAWQYGLRAALWGGAILLSFGLVYPWAATSLERYKLRNTYYGDLRGQFQGSGLGLFIRGFALWIIVVGPLLVALAVTLGGFDWRVPAAAEIDTDLLGRIEQASPGFILVLGEASLLPLLSLAGAFLAYPLFRAIRLRWWLAGVQFGAITVTSRLRPTDIYAVYLRAAWYFLILTLIVTTLSACVFFLTAFLATWLGDAAEAVKFAIVLGLYVVMALAYWAVYQATVRLPLWRLAVESARLGDFATLDAVRAAGAAGERGPHMRSH